MKRLAIILLITASCGIDTDDHDYYEALRHDARWRTESGYTQREIQKLKKSTQTDLGKMVRLWLFNDPNLAEPIPFDYNNDGRIDMIDFAELSKEYK